jgi:hypothetical protein
VKIMPFLMFVAMPGITLPRLALKSYNYVKEIG